jgi:P4 family phage/plasmid primase-like protien
MTMDSKSIEDRTASLSEGVRQLLGLTQDGEIHLTLIHPEKPQGRNMEFGGRLSVDNVNETAERLAEYQAEGWNVYWNPNGSKVGCGRAKTRKDHMTEIRAVWVDIDPSDLKDSAKVITEFQQSRRDIQAAIAALPVNLKPTAIVDSGGGFQAFWMLRQSVPAGGTNTATAEAIGSSLAAIFQTATFKADPVQAISTVLRVPGTRNFPNAEKKAKGRGQYEARMVEMDSSRRYTIDQLLVTMGPTEGGVQAKASFNPKSTATGFVPGMAMPAVSAPMSDVEAERAFIGALPAEVRADLLAVQPALQKYEDLGLVWRGRHLEAKKADGTPFTDTSEPAMFLLTQLAAALPGEVTVERLRALAEVSRFIRFEYQDKWNRDDHFADDECQKALDFADACELERLEARVADMEQFGPVDADSDRTHSLTSDLANAKRLKRELGGKVVNSPHLGPLIWNGQCWKAGKEAVSAACDRLSSIYAAEIAELGRQAADPSTRKAARESLHLKIERLNKGAIACEDKRILDRARDLFLRGHTVAAEQFDSHLWLLNTPTGIVDLKTGQLLPHDPGLYLIQITSVGYDPNAACPRWEQFMLEICGGDMDLVEYLQKLLGYSLTGEVMHHILAIFEGGGNNGKSVLLRVIATLLGDYASLMPMSLLIANQKGASALDFAMLAGRRFVYAVETPAGGKLNETVVKQISGGDMMLGRHNYQSYFSFTPQFLPVVSTNHKPEILGTDTGIWRRIAMVPFRVDFKALGKIDHGLREKLIAEGPGILRWLVDGCLKWQAFGLEPPVAVKEATEGYRSSQDRVAGFVAEHLDLTDPAAGVYFEEIYARYRGACTSSGLVALSDKRFGAEFDRVLQSHGRQRRLIRNKQFCEGVKLQHFTPVNF